MRHSEKHSLRHVDLFSQAISLDEMGAYYSGKWVLIKVTAFDENHIPSHGYVIAHGSQRRVHKVLYEVLSGPEKHEGPYYVFSAYPRGRTGAELIAVLAETARQGDLGASRSW